MYMLIKAQLVSMLELKTVYTLDEALKLLALYQRDKDIEIAQQEESKRKMEDKR